MTIRYRNYKAWIYCDDDRKMLEEYAAGPDPDDERVYTCWVASEAGKRFTVHWGSLSRSEGDNKGVVYVDGVEANFYINRMDSDKGGASSGVKTAAGDLRPYSFSNVVLTDDDTYLGVEQTTDTDELGNITLKIFPVCTYYEPVRDSHRPRRSHHRQEVTLYDGAIHETTKAICDHRITLGDAMPFWPPSDRPRSRKLMWYPRDHRDSVPRVVFRFKYRPRAYLQAQGIIPTPANVEDTPRKPTIDNLHYGRHEPGQKHRRPLAHQDPSHRNISHGRSTLEPTLFLPTPSREPSQAPQYRGNARADYFENPRWMEELGKFETSRRKRSNIKDENANSPVSKRTKLDPITPVKVENESCLRIDEHGVIDLTMDD